MNPALLSLAFALALVSSLLVKTWLATRQSRFVARHRAAVPPAFAGKITLESHQKAADYTLAKLRLGVMSETFATAVTVAWTFLGGLDALNRATLRLVGPGWHGLPYELALFGAFALVNAALDLPFELWRTFRLEQRFGFNKTTPRLFAADLAKQAALSIALGGPILALVLWLMHAAGPLWWLWAWAAVSAYLVVFMFLKPVLIDPIFNKFEPLPDGPVVERSRALMARCGFRAKGFFVMDGSRRSGHGNAYFTGFGATKRVVFYDTLLAQLDADEIEAVLAHELGHFRHHDMPKRLAFALVLYLGLFALLGWLAHQVPFYAGLNVMINAFAPNDALALLLFTLALPPFAFFVAPVLAALSRRAEYRADAYARSNADAAHLVQALVKLQDDNKGTLTPDPLFVRFYYSHPPVSARIAALGVPPSAFAGAAA
jgi:STE24 endopeptidase